MASIAERIRRFREAPPRSRTERCARPPAPAPARLPRRMLGEGMTLEDLHQPAHTLSPPSPSRTLGPAAPPPPPPPGPSRPPASRRPARTDGPPRGERLLPGCADPVGRRAGRARSAFPARSGGRSSRARKGYSPSRPPTGPTSGRPCRSSPRARCPPPGRACSPRGARWMARRPP